MTFKAYHCGLTNRWKVRNVDTDEVLHNNFTRKGQAEMTAFTLSSKDSGK